MRFFLLAFFYFLFNWCLDDDQTAPIDALEVKFNKDICSQGIKPGGQADVDFVNKVVVPYYMNETWLTKAPPAGWEKERHKIVAKCHKNSYNYCLEADQNKWSDCVKGMAGSLMLKYGATAMSFCPIFNEKVANFQKDDLPQVNRFFTQYCKTKGKTC
ncbi:hypothetical protein PILCRDRAFT_823549 [Piloderma croceum F 1598]|uniref:Uncharacterized protein n=1 Tax=Piloderma croceum (strain F 1598) TaxID=765440 RepID=A0A0C3FI51_PILCF|nr:hypothetical protein PILCRDRAFT_823549 [Piloderma croceum F 1598]